MISGVLIAALIAVESHGDNFAFSARGEVGCLQISSDVVIDCNRIQDLVHFTPADRLDREKSVMMAEVYLGYYASKERIGREPTDQDRARIWAGGPDGWVKPATLPYWRKVQQEFLHMAVTQSPPAVLVTPGFNFSSASVNAPVGDNLMREPV